MKTLIAASLLCASTAALAEDARHVYRLDFVINESDGNKSSSTNCTLNVEEKRMGEIKLGINVPLAQGGSTARADIGLLLRANVVAVGDDLLVDNDIEISGAKDASSFRKVVARGNALISQGKPALVASIEEPASHKRYEVKVTATKLR